jgi:hypothetical protein
MLLLLAPVERDLHPHGYSVVEVLTSPSVPEYCYSGTDERIAHKSMKRTGERFWRGCQGYLPPLILVVRRASIAGVGSLENDPCVLSLGGKFLVRASSKLVPGFF